MQIIRKTALLLIMTLAIYGGTCIGPQNINSQAAFAEAGDYVLGSIRLFPYNYTPKGWVRCDRNSVIFVRDHIPFYQLYGDYLDGNIMMVWTPDLSNASPIPGLSYYMAIDGEAPSDTYTETTFVGEICLFPEKYKPPHYLPCDGETVKINDDNRSLFDFIGTRYGGDGEKSFGLPDLAKHAPEGFSYWIACQGIYSTDYSYCDQYLGAVSLFAVDPGKSYFPCSGQQLPIGQYTALYYLLKDNFATDNKTYFRLPDLRGANPIPDLQYSIGVTGRWPIQY